MTTSAILFGSIGTIVETSEMQRQAFNQAFEEAGLDWNWDEAEYKERLQKSGGKTRIEEYAREQGIDVDAEALHSRKTELFDEAMKSKGLQPRSGVAEVLQNAKQNGLKVGFVTTTSQDNIDAMFEALRGQINREDFDFIGDVSMVNQGKPAPDIYQKAVAELGLGTQGCVAVEDTAVSMQSATAAGIKCIAFPGNYADRNAFPKDATVTNSLSVSDLLESH